MTFPRRIISALAVSSVACLVSLAPLHAQAVISEVVAVNDRLLADSDNEFPDFIELFNPTDTTVQLDGWLLSDDFENLDKWAFPAVELAPNAFLLVFASGKDRTDPGAELHTNFRLTSAGEALVLSQPDRTPVSFFAPQFPEQVLGASYGFEMETSSTEIVSGDSSVRYLVPESEEFDEVWRQPDFDDSGWSEGALPLGFDNHEPPALNEQIATDLGELMFDINSTVYLRVSFNLAAEQLETLIQLRVQYNDGFIAYINGVEVGRRGVNTRNPRYNTRGSIERTAEETLAEEVVPLRGTSELLVEGENVLAIHATNRRRADEDFFLRFSVEALEILSVDTGAPKYFVEPTVEWPNSDGRSGIAPRPAFSSTGGLFADSTEITLSLPDDVEGSIRYTVDGSPVTEASSLYTEAITLDATANVRARSFGADQIPSPTVEHTFVQVDASLSDWESSLPVFIVSTSSRTIGGSWVPGNVILLDRNEQGKTPLTSEAEFVGRMSIKERGSSSSGRPKQSYTMEIQDERGEDRDVELLGFPAESDYVLYGAFNFDRARLRNPLIYELSNQVGRYAVRTRFCEVFVNSGNGRLANSHYRGVYSFCEKIKQGPGRVDIAEIEPHQNAEPEVTGGYIMKIDRLDPGDQGFTGGGQRMGFVYPKEREISRDQSRWLGSFMNQMSQSLSTPDYGALIDVDSWIDHHLLNVLPKNVDALRLSGYMFKNREGKLEMGPIWDFDRSMNSTDSRDDSPTTWRGGGDATDYFTYPWWNQLFRHDSFWDRYSERWTELRSAALSDTNITNVIDVMAAEIRPVIDRDLRRWGQGNVQSWEREVTALKNWLTTRARWMDTQLIAQPRFSHPGGPVSVGFQVEITLASGEIIYTLDGSDPRARDGSLSEAAQRYTGPISIMESANVQARALVGGSTWSEPVGVEFFVGGAPLALTEIMYHVLDLETDSFSASNYDWLELQNVGAEPLDLAGFELVGRVRFAFSSGTVQTLAPGEVVVVTRNLDAFAERNPGVERVVGPFQGSLSDASATIEVMDPDGVLIVKTTYEDEWYPESDGMGHSLEIRDTATPIEAWTLAESWKASDAPGGTPGVGVGGGANPAGRQLPGDTSQDGDLNVIDAVAMFRLLRGEVDAPCGGTDGMTTLLDNNGDTRVDPSDVVYLLNHIFMRQPAPVLGERCQPIPGCGNACQ